MRKVVSTVSNNYRKQTENLRVTYDDIVNDENYKGKEFVELSDAMAAIDYIEGDLSEVINILEDIEGLSEIDDVKCKLKKLSYNVY